MSRLSTAPVWLRRLFAWSDSPEARRERVGLIVALVLVIGWALLALRLPVSGIVITGAVLVAVLALMERFGLVKLLGPVFWYDTIRTARRGRYFLIRWLYAIGLLLLLLWVHSIWSLENRYQNATNAGWNEYKALAQLAEQYFFAFAIVQFAAVVFMTPAYVGGAIAEEKERKTLEFLLATDLHNSEIVFGKLAARVGNLALFLLTGLPVLSLMQFFGGIDPGLLLVSFAVTALTAASLSGLALLNSTMRRRVRDAIVLTYLAVFGYAALTGAAAMLKWVCIHYGWVATLVPPYSFTLFGHSFDGGGIDTGDLFDAFTTGNPIFGMVNVSQVIWAGGYYGDVLAEELKKYAIFHGLIAGVSLVWAVVRLRSVALVQAAGPRRATRSRRAPKRPPVGPRPMLWKEVRVEGNLRFGWFGYAIVIVLVAASFVPVGLITYFDFFDTTGTRISWRQNLWDEFGQHVNIWMRIISAVVSSLMLLGVAVRGAGAVSAERDRDTLTSLLTTPLTAGEMLWAKWWGSLLSVRVFLWWIGSIWAVGLVTGAVHIMAIPLHMVMWLAPAAFFAVLGLWFSTVCKTSLRATIWTLLSAIFAGGAHWICTGMCCFLPLGLMSRGGSGSELKWLYMFEAGMSPPFVFGWVPFRELKDLDFDRDGLFPGFALVGAVLWCVAAAAVGHFTHERFQELTHRNEWERKAVAPGGRDEDVPVVRAADDDKVTR